MVAFLIHWVERINRLVILLTFRHAGPWIKSRASLDKPAPAFSKPGASRNSLDSGACPGPRSGVRRNDAVVDNYEMVNNTCTCQHIFY
jgi:hypothetical protein